jgi:hypothetical protein
MIKKINKIIHIFSIFLLIAAFCDLPITPNKNFR